MNVNVYEIGMEKDPYRGDCGAINRNQLRLTEIDGDANRAGTASDCDYNGGPYGDPIGDPG